MAGRGSYQRVCRGCGKAFITPNARRLCCSADCEAKRRRLRDLEQKAREAQLAEAIRRGDRWISEHRRPGEFGPCSTCGEPGTAKLAGTSRTFCDECYRRWNRETAAPADSWSTAVEQGGLKSRVRMIRDRRKQIPA